MPLSNAWFGFGVGEDFSPLTLGSPFLAAIIPPIPHRLLEDLMAGSDMDSPSPSPSDKIPTSGEYYQLFLKTSPNLLLCLHLVLHSQLDIGLQVRSWPLLPLWVY